MKQILVIVLLLILVAGGAYWYFSQRTIPDATSNSDISPSPIASTTPQATAGYKIYTNSADNFSFEYPDDWEETEATDGATIKKAPSSGNSNRDRSVTVTVYKGKSNYKAYDFLDKIYYSGDNDDRDQPHPLVPFWIKNNDKIELTQIDNHPAEKITELSEGYGSAGWGVWITRGNDGIFLHFPSSSDPNAKIISQRILDSFKFN